MKLIDKNESSRQSYFVEKDNKHYCVNLYNNKIVKSIFECEYCGNSHTHYNFRKLNTKAVKRLIGVGIKELTRMIIED